LIRADARQPLVAHKLLEQAQRSVKGSTGAAELLGPVSPNMERRAGWHRAQLLVSAKTRQARFKALKALQQVLGQKAPRSIRWSIDVDPADFF
jgi:primosomal protein N' (replication factor Y)